MPPCRFVMIRSCIPLDFECFYNMILALPELKMYSDFSAYQHKHLIWKRIRREIFRLIPSIIRLVEFLNYTVRGIINFCDFFLKY